MAHGIIVINLGGEKRTVCFNNHSLIYLGQLLKCDPADIMDKVGEIGDLNPLRLLTFVIYAGLMGYKESIAEYIHDITMPNVALWVSEANEDEFASVWETFSQALGIPKATAEQVKEYEKKNKKPIKQLSKK